MNRIQEIEQKLMHTEHLVELLAAEYAHLRLVALQQVKVVKNGETLTLTFGNRELKVKRHPRYTARWNVFEAGRKIVSEYLGGIHDLRFAISQHQV